MHRSPAGVIAPVTVERVSGVTLLIHRDDSVAAVRQLAIVETPRRCIVPVVDPRVALLVR